jgi:hypothetical protein
MTDAAARRQADRERLKSVLERAAELGRMSRRISEHAVELRARSDAMIATGKRIKERLSTTRSA